MVSINILIYKKQYFTPFFNTDFRRHQTEFQTLLLQDLWCIEKLKIYCTARRTLLKNFESFSFFILALVLENLIAIQCLDQKSSQFCNDITMKFLFEA